MLNASRGGGASVKKQSCGELRLHKDISEFNGKDDLMNFEVSIKPDYGYYQLSHNSCHTGGVVEGLLVENSLKLLLNFGEVSTYLVLNSVKEYMLVKPARDAAAKMEAETATAIDDGRLHDDNESTIR
ncbi:Uncharacterized protein Rs2_42061 [Raphanus sativus]|nr:hypothetical protein Rs2_46703 [Raphanus sativus]KAJ4877043.1 Uncharacterized protein Rs2_42061 [Raphanus sativus]